MTFLKSEKLHVFYSIILGIIGGLVGTAIFGLSGYMISLSFFEPPFFLIILIIAMIKMFGLTKGVSKYLERLLSHDATFKMIGRLRRDYFKNSLASLQDTHSVRYIQKLTSYFDDIEDYYVRIIYPYIVAAFIALILTMLSLIVDPVLLLITLSTSLFILVLMPLVMSKVSNKLKATRQMNEDNLFDQLYRYIFDYVNLFVVKEDIKTKDTIKDSYKAITLNENKEARLDLVIEVIGLLVQLLAMIGILYFFRDEHAILIPMIILLLMSYFETIIPVVKPASRYFSVRQSVQDISDYTVMEDKNKQTDLNLEHITFRYPNTKKDVLKDISIHIPTGQKHALIGSSGSGKTTLLNQLIKISDAGVMPQHLDFYNATVEENLTMFGHFSLKDDQNYLQDFDLEHFSLDDYITSNEYLSLGEKKRMQVIRLLIEDKDTWILDEPTASLNTRLKERVWDILLERNTLIVATHDLSHLEKFDVVHYMENGEIVESGPVKEILSQNGPTREAYERYKDII